MSRTNERLTSLFAGAIMAAVAMPAIAVAAPPSLPPPSPPAGPVPVPYPNPEPPPVPECPASLCPKAAATLEVQAERGSSGHGRSAPIEVKSHSWGSGTNRLSADPQEGGQVAGRKAGKLQHESRGLPPGPSESGTLTIRVARGSVVKGQHLPEVTLSAEGRAYRLRDVEVARCTAGDDRSDTCVLIYASLAE